MKLKQIIQRFSCVILLSVISLNAEITQPNQSELEKFKTTPTYQVLKEQENTYTHKEVMGEIEQSEKKALNNKFDISSIKVEEDEKNKELINSLNNVKFDEVMKNVKLVGDEVINAKVDEFMLDHKMKEELYKREDYFTIFYFISKSISINAIERFINDYKKLKEKNKNVNAKLILRGYPTFYGERTVGKIDSKTWFKKESIKSKFGTFTINDDGVWEYKVNKGVDTNLLPKKSIFNDTISYEDYKTKQKHKLEVELIVEEKVLKVVVKNSPDGMYHYLNDIRAKTELQPEDMEFYVNPWVFKQFNLEKVPAYALSKCKLPFKFKHCEALYLAKGEMNLATFFQILGDKTPSYKKFYFDIIEAK